MARLNKTSKWLNSSSSSSSSSSNCLLNNNNSSKKMLKCKCSIWLEIQCLNSPFSSLFKTWTLSSNFWLKFLCKMWADSFSLCTLSSSSLIWWIRLIRCLKISNKISIRCRLIVCRYFIRFGMLWWSSLAKLETKLVKI